MTKGDYVMYQAPGTISYPELAIIHDMNFTYGQTDYIVIRFTDRTRRMVRPYNIRPLTVAEKILFLESIDDTVI